LNIKLLQTKASGESAGAFHLKQIFKSSKYYLSLPVRQARGLLPAPALFAFGAFISVFYFYETRIEKTKHTTICHQQNFL